MTTSRLVSFFLFATLLPACSGFGLSGGTVPVSGSASQPSARQIPAGVKQLSIPADSCCVLAVDHRLNEIYVSRGADPHGSHTTIVSGRSFTVTHKLTKFGGANDVDAKTDDVWLPGLYAGDVEVYSGRTNAPVTKVGLSDCPVASWVDTRHRYAWISAQCGSGDDPVWAVNADTYAVAAGPIGSGGVMGPIFVNSVTGRFYVTSTGGSFEINPKTFALTATTFGTVMNGNDITGMLFAQIPDGLNIVDGRSEKVLKTVALTYTPGAIGVNADLNHVYLVHQNVVEVREGNTGRLLKTLRFPSSVTVASVDADQRRDRIYATGVAGSTLAYLYEIDDTY